MDIFARNKRNALRIIIAALIILLVGAALIVYGIVSDDREDAKSLAALNKGEYGYLTLEGFGGPFAVNDRNKQYYYFGVLGDGTLVLVDVDSATHWLWQHYINDEAAWEANRPLRVEGRVRSTQSELKSFARNGAAELGIAEPLSDQTLDHYFSTTSTGGTATTLIVIGIIAAIIGLTVLYIGVSQLSRVKKIKRSLQSRYPNYDDFNFLDERKDLDIPELKLFVKDDLVFSEQGGLSVADLNDVGWMHLQLVNRRYGSSPFLWAYSASRKNKRIALPLSGKSGQAAERLYPLFNYVQEKFPRILLGFSKENKQLYRSSFDA